MPELPEVEYARHSIEISCLKAVISHLNVVEQGNGPREGLFDDKVIESLEGPNVFSSSLENSTVVSVNRRGKQLWLDLQKGDNMKCLLIHLGMTGAIVMKDQKPPTYQSYRIDSEHWPPKFTKLELSFTNGVRISFCDPRRLGKVCIRSYPAIESPPISLLAVDPLLDALPSAEDLQHTLSTVTAPIKAVLLDQNRIFCGIGNYIADEVLYQSRIHPETKSKTLSKTNLESLLKKLQEIIVAAVACLKNDEDFPKDWLFHYRWKKGSSNKDDQRMPDGSPITFVTVAGRTSAVVASSLRATKKKFPEVAEAIEDEAAQHKKKKPKKSQKQMSK